MRNKDLGFSGGKKLGGRHGEIIEKEDQIVKLLGREICVVVYKYKSGMVKSTCYFADSDMKSVKKRNTELLRDVFELREEIKKLKDKK